jgi:hypothetical protein
MWKGLRGYNCVGNLGLCVSVRVLEPGSYTGVNKENEAAGNWNLMRKVQPAVHANKVPGKVTSSDVVMNSVPGYGRSRQAAKSKFLLKCMSTAVTQKIKTESLMT